MEMEMEMRKEILNGHKWSRLNNIKSNDNLLENMELMGGKYEG